jgi:hypothetical protein
MSMAVIVYATLCIFGAAIVRGYSGFGFSLLAISALSLAMPPAQFVPSIFLLEIAASIHLLPGIWRDIHWRSLIPLILGCAAATPLGVWLMAKAPEAPMQVGLAVFVLIATFLLWRGFALKTMPGKFTSTAVGAASGFANGATGIGGPPVILFYFASPAGNIAGRASVVAYFLITDLVGLGFQAQAGLINTSIFIQALFFLPALLAGVWLGARSFKSADPETFRRWVFVLLAILGLATGLQGLSKIVG